MRRLGVAALTLALGCADLLLEPDPPNDPMALFDELWMEFDRYYSHFEIKNIDWAAVGAEHRTHITPTSTDAQLFTLLSDMLDVLQDGHVNLWTPIGTYEWDGWFAPYPESFVAARTNQYLTSAGVAAGGVRWGHIGADVGYIHIATFEDPRMVAEFDDALAALSGVRGIVVDVRHNGGGSSTRAATIANRFADAAYHYQTVRYRNGPSHTDYTPPRQDSVRPDRVAWRGPVVLLTNRRVFSAAETFVLAMRVLPQVIVVGDTTGGGSGNPITRELSNGWVYRVPRWIVRTPEGNTYEGVGLGPDVWVQFDPADASVKGDPILDTALIHLAR
ncbi:MAG: S41 family peptidase [Gemmatimonadales bacterium]